jgi:predicted MPP superfamily phosphohydrolase
MNRIVVLSLIALVCVLIDWYAYQAVRTVSQSFSPVFQRTFRAAFWGVTLLSVLIVGASLVLNADFWGRFRHVRTFLWTFVFVTYFSKLVMVPVLLLDDTGRFLRWLARVFTRPSAPEPGTAAEAIPRSAFLMKTALLVGAVPAVAFTYGILSGAHDYRVRRVRLPIRGLPRAFDGLRIGQLSDIHSGSFFNKTAVRGGVELLLGEKPDVVFFTGDLVNDRASEVRGYLDVFDQVRAPLGVYSILGNHDYGDYATWESAAAKRQNLLDLRRAHQLLGWDLLLDEHRFLQVGTERIALLGIQNWGTGGFAQYGNLARAYAGTEEVPTRLLLSHDPSHWDAQVRPQFPGIAAAFAGHTHGMQFGVEVGGFRWSPVQYRYKQWAGLYQEGDQYLYVNRGFGYLGYPGRVGMPPEITMIELQAV